MKKVNFRSGDDFQNLSSSADASVASSGDIPPWLYSLLMEYISYAMICVSVFGMAGKILIIITYIKIGFSESINISYCALGISDALCVTFITWNAICFIPAFSNWNPPVIPREFVIPTGGASTDIFCQTTAWITACISLERCLCVVFPFKVKTLVTRRRTLFGVITISSVIIVPLLGLNCVLYVFDKTFDIERNRTLLRLKYRNANLADKIYDIYVIYRTVFLNCLPLLTILICTIYLTIHLKISAKWRLGNSHRPGKGKENPDNTNDESAKRKYGKDMRVVKTVLSIAVAFLLLGTLSVLRLVVAMIWTEFRPLGGFGKSYRFTSRLAFLLLQTNSSVNFIIYYRMGSKFRQSVKDMFCTHKKNPASNDVFTKQRRVLSRNTGSE